MKRAAAWSAVILLGLCLVGCAPKLSDDGTPLTIEQSQTLASVRFALYAHGDFTAHVSALPDDDVDHLDAALTVDPAAHRAWGTVARGPADLAEKQRLLLTPDGAATGHGGDWSPAELSSAQLGTLRTVFSLASDRPENAQLLRQGAARYLGTSEAGGDEAEVYRLPSSEGSGAGRTRLWVATDDDMVVRLDAGDDTTLVVMIGTGAAEAAPATAEQMWSLLERQQ